MSLDGIWVLELDGTYGWERVSTVFMEKGRYLGGGPIYFTQGTYVSKAKKVRIELQVTRHGKKETAIFGQHKTHFSTVMKGKYKGDKIEGKMSLVGAKSTAAKYHFRLLRQAAIPPVPSK